MFSGCVFKVMVSFGGVFGVSIFSIHALYRAITETNDRLLLLGSSYLPLTVYFNTLLLVTVMFSTLTLSSVNVFAIQILHHILYICIYVS